MIFLAYIHINNVYDVVCKGLVPIGLLYFKKKSHQSGVFAQKMHKLCMINSIFEENRGGEFNLVESEEMFVESMNFECVSVLDRQTRVKSSIKKMQSCRIRLCGGNENKY